MNNPIFIQDRVGVGGASFELYKIQTMYPNTYIPQELIQSGYKDANDTRIIPSHRWLRKTGIDEIPQIVNILLGDMSIFGARAVVPEVFDVFSPGAKRRYISNKPGIIGRYLFDRDKKIGKPYCSKNARRANDAYLRLRYQKRNDSLGIISMNILALKRSLGAILVGKHK